MYRKENQQVCLPPFQFRGENDFLGLSAKDDVSMAYAIIFDSRDFLRYLFRTLSPNRRHHAGYSQPRGSKKNINARAYLKIINPLLTPCELFFNACECGVYRTKVAVSNTLRKSFGFHIHICCKSPHPKLNARLSTICEQLKLYVRKWFRCAIAAPQVSRHHWQCCPTEFGENHHSHT